MRDTRAINRSGIKKPRSLPAHSDPRVHTDLAHLRSLAQHIQSLRLLPRQAANSILNGRHHSKLRGRGLDFEELRNYLPGDDSRTIDWKVTARTGKPYVRVYTEERDRPTLIIVDQRMSMFFGSRLNMKSVTAAEAAALTAFTTLAQGDRIGGVIFTDDQLLEFKPQQSQKALNGILMSLADINLSLNANKIVSESMSLNRPIEMAARLAKNNHLIAIFSDFDNINDTTKSLLASMANHNDVLLFLITDPLAHALGKNLQLTFSDGQLQASMDTSQGHIEQKLNDFFQQRFATIAHLSEQLGIPVLPLSSGQDTLIQIRQLMGIPG